MVGRAQLQELVDTILGKDLRKVRSVLREFKVLDAKLPERKNRPAGERLLMLAAEAGTLPVVRLLVSHGADVDAANQFRQTALLYAIRANNAPIVSFLLRAGADPNLRMSDGDSLLSEAARKGIDIKITRELLKAGANPLAASHAGSTALHVAAFQDRLDVAKLLLKAGANPNARDRDAHGPISCAILRANWALASFLAKNNADPKKQPEALGVAAAAGHTRLVGQLVDQGWDATSKSHQNHTPIWHAQKGRRKAIVALLQKANA